MHRSITTPVGRADQRNRIEHFVHDMLAGNTSALYVHGTTGTGKTLMVRDVLQAMNAQLEEVRCRVCMGVWLRLVAALPRCVCVSGSFVCDASTIVS